MAASGERTSALISAAKATVRAPIQRTLHRRQRPSATPPLLPQRHVECILCVHQHFVAGPGEAIGVRDVHHHDLHFMAALLLRRGQNLLKDGPAVRPLRGPQSLKGVFRLLSPLTQQLVDRLDERLRFDGLIQKHIHRQIGLVRREAVGHFALAVQTGENHDRQVL
jgi:hypothetical protein